uniref:Peptidase M50 domain-containing protein n=1 Tax=Brassica oleracea var. oleracea TaxID=109376 RepID=A0A0D3C3N4_BRAOL
MLLNISSSPISHRNPHFPLQFQHSYIISPSIDPKPISQNHTFTQTSLLYWPLPRGYSPRDVSKFAIGFGPILAKFDFKNVEYSLMAFPLGGWFACDGLLAGDVIIAVDRTNLSKTAPDAFSKGTPDKNFDVTGKIGVRLSPNVRITKVKPRNIPETFRFARKEFMELYSNVFGEVARSNIDGLYQFVALLNVNLAVLILLPLPAPDGGTLALIVLETVRKGRKLPVEVEQGIMSSGIMLVVFIGLFLIVEDTLSLDFIRERL